MTFDASHLAVLLQARSQLVPEAVADARSERAGQAGSSGLFEDGGDLGHASVADHFGLGAVPDRMREVAFDNDEVADGDLDWLGIGGAGSA
ncbi:MAG: hypothetical protein B5766_10335 [Candidatus Lumbricidophila eiseniae]|uniref:Uncharacterized protein n=1 Tax=Candidatus Lumbricidiphila eiseniae TaxID=1969409 RepID=A0A2A6FPP4_9MICO|nr:MAG: hypothetical protein B5766_10335 [Candidatus Lumbricidophila eiseniae]